MPQTFFPVTFGKFVLPFLDVISKEFYVSQIGMLLRIPQTRLHTHNDTADTPRTRTTVLAKQVLLS